MDVDAGDLKPGLRELHGQGQADIAKSDDADLRRPIADLLFRATAVAES